MMMKIGSSIPILRCYTARNEECSKYYGSTHLFSAETPQLMIKRRQILVG